MSSASLSCNSMTSSKPSSRSAAATAWVISMPQAPGRNEIVLHPDHHGPGLIVEAFRLSDLRLGRRTIGEEFGGTPDRQRGNDPEKRGDVGERIKRMIPSETTRPAYPRAVLTVEGTVHHAAPARETPAW